MPITIKDLNRDTAGEAVADTSKQAYDARTRFSDHQAVIEATPAKHYSYAEEMEAKRRERAKPVDILDVLAANPKLHAENRNRHQEETTRAQQESWRIERQLEAERSAAANLKSPASGPVSR